MLCGEWYELLNIELGWMRWGLLKGNESGKHTNLWRNLKWVHGVWYGFLNIELAETQLGLLKGNEPSEHMNLW